MEKEYAVLIGYRIRQERVQRNISQPEMADILGISYSYYKISFRMKIDKRL
jgi:transcriptional regulator with XRE-family HTH domain